MTRARGRAPALAAQRAAGCTGAAPTERRSGLSVDAPLFLDVRPGSDDATLGPTDLDELIQGTEAEEVAIGDGSSVLLFLGQGASGAPDCASYDWAAYCVDGDGYCDEGDGCCQYDLDHHYGGPCEQTSGQGASCADYDWTLYCVDGDGYCDEADGCCQYDEDHHGGGVCDTSGASPAGGDEVGAACEDYDWLSFCVGGDGYCDEGDGCCAVDPDHHDGGPCDEGGGAGAGGCADYDRTAYCVDGDGYCDEGDGCCDYDADHHDGGPCDGDGAAGAGGCDGYDETVFCVDGDDWCDEGDGCCAYDADDHDGGPCDGAAEDSPSDDCADYDWSVLCVDGDDWCDEGDGCCAYDADDHDGGPCGGTAAPAPARGSPAPAAGVLPAVAAVYELILWGRVLYVTLAAGATAETVRQIAARSRNSSNPRERDVAQALEGTFGMGTPDPGCPQGPWTDECCEGGYIGGLGDRFIRAGDNAVFVYDEALSRVECCLEWDAVSEHFELFTAIGQWEEALPDGQIGGSPHRGARECDDLAGNPCRHTDTGQAHNLPDATGGHDPRTSACADFAGTQVP